MSVLIIVAYSQNRIIGNKNELPWDIREDLKFFHEATVGKIVIMGRKTYESIPEEHRPLKNRTTYVLSRDMMYNIDHPNVRVFHDFEKALMVARLRSNGEDIIIAGGAQIYEQALPHTDRVYATVILEDFKGDTYFPELPTEEWDVVSSIEDFVDSQLDIFYRRYVLQRKSQV